MSNSQFIQSYWSAFILGKGRKPLAQRQSVKMASAAAIVPIKLNKTVVMKSGEKIVKTSATEVRDSAMISGKA